MKKTLIIVLLAIHLLLLAAGTALIDFAKIPMALQGPVTYYLALVGGHNYAFFSLDIPTQTVVKCYITDNNGAEHTESFERSTNTFELRTTYLFQVLDDASGHEVAADIASRYCFKQYPGAKSVKVSIGVCVVPSITEYKAGKGNSFSEVYSQTYNR